MENGVKNLKGASLFPKTFSNHGFGAASVPDWVVSRILCKIGDRCILPFFTSVDKGNQDVIIDKLFGREDDYRC